MPTAPVPEIVRFRHHLRPVVVAGEGVYLFDDDGATSVVGRQVEALAGLLERGATLPRLLEEASSSMPLGQARETLRVLLEAELLTTHEPHAAGGAPAAELAFWDGVGLDPVPASVATRTALVEIVTLGGPDPDPLRRALIEAGIAGTVRTDPSPVPGADLTVVLAADHLDPALADVDAAQRAAGRPWLLSRTVGAQVWVGPWFVPGVTACWHCLAGRAWAHRAAEAHVQRRRGRAGHPLTRPTAALTTLGPLAAGLLATEVATRLAGHLGEHCDALTVLDTTRMTTTRHAVTRRPECPSCGDPTEYTVRAAAPFVVRSRPARDRNGGGYRAASPAATLAAYRHLVSPVTGVVPHLVRDPRGPEGLHVFRAGGNAAAGGSLDQLRAGLRCQNSGKGTTAEQAEVGALCEALERHSGQFRGDEPRRRASFRDLQAAGERPVHPNDVTLLDPRQYAGRTAWNAQHSPFQRVPEPFDDDACLDWTPVWSLTAGVHRWLPTAQLYFGAPGPASLRPDSNGCAAGSSPEDAALQGLLELVERDAVALWWYNRTAAAEVSVVGTGDPWIDGLPALWESLHREVWVLDLTTDLGVPVRAAVSRRTDRGRGGPGTDPCEDIVFGFGAHPDPAIALRRALTELHQMLPQLVDAGADGEYGCEDPDAVSWWRTATVDAHPHLRPSADAVVTPARTFAADDAVLAGAGDLGAVLTELVGRIEAAGLEVLVLDQTRADVGLPVVRVIVPGLRSMWARFAPGRLFDVPVRLGRQAVPTAYAALNPVPMFL